MDANATLYVLQPPCGEITYTSMAESFMLYILDSSRGISRENLSQIHIVFDRYFEQSVKSATRDKTTGGSRANIYHVQQAWGEYWTKVLEYKYKYVKN